ncbi:MAG: hypothetical protein EOP83_26855 [Verrucomicrobiaceae bacterium]|nr:MAG: hypothetical protein EOP83_26855 [Verrucomicrobiaceae bacterium]
MIELNEQTIMQIENPLMREIAFMQWLTQVPYLNVRPIGNGRWAGIMELMFHVAVVGGPLYDFVGLGFRYCYHGPDGVKSSKQEAYKVALAALDAWDPQTESEPQGWHRDPFTHRRRPMGNAAEEYVEG